MHPLVAKGIHRISRYLRARSTLQRFKPSFDPFTYTHGRWLDRDEERRHARVLHFDFDALLELAVHSSPGAQRVADCEKKEGGFNRVFLIRLDNGKTVVARLPTRNAGPPSLTVSSEVATLRFVKERTGIPVPNVLAWSSRKDNKIGSEYIIMDEMPGVELGEVWRDMKTSQHIACIKNLGLMIANLWKIRFPSYGSLYLSKESLSDAVQLDNNFNIGPLSTLKIWESDTNPWNTGNCNPSLGPWHSVDAYLSGLLSQAEAYIQAKSKKAGGIRDSTAEQEHIELLDIVRKTQKIVIELDDVREAGTPTLFHPDLNTRNIFVDPEDPTKITGIIDWQSAAIQPTFVMLNETPDFAQEVELPDHEHSMSESSPTKTIPTQDSAVKDPTVKSLENDAEEISPQEKIRLDAEFCTKMWAVILQICPETRSASYLDRQLINLLVAGSTGWLKDVFSIQQILLGLDQEWDELKLPGEGLYKPAKDKIAEVKEQLETMKTKKRVQDHLFHLLSCQPDGWVPSETWDQVLPVYRREYQRFLDAHFAELEDGQTRDEARRQADSLWPFDQR